MPRPSPRPNCSPPACLAPMAPPSPGKATPGPGVAPPGGGGVWRISPDGKTVTEMFRIPSMVNDVAVPNAGTGVGRDVRSVPPAGVTIPATSRNGTATALGSQPLVANGLQFFNHRLYIVDTARGAVWRVKVNQDS